MATTDHCVRPKAKKWALDYVIAAPQWSKIYSCCKTFLRRLRSNEKPGLITIFWLLSFLICSVIKKLFFTKLITRPWRTNDDWRLKQKMLWKIFQRKKMSSARWGDVSCSKKNLWHTHACTHTHSHVHPLSLSLTHTHSLMQSYLHIHPLSLTVSSSHTLIHTLLLLALSLRVDCWMSQCACVCGWVRVRERVCVFVHVGVCVTVNSSPEPPRLKADTLTKLNGKVSFLNSLLIIFQPLMRTRSSRFALKPHLNCFVRCFHC